MSRTSHPETPGAAAWTALLCVLAGIALAGCQLREEFRCAPPTDYCPPVVQQIEYPEVEALNAPCPEISEMGFPATVANYEELEKWPLTLEEAVQIALENSQVIREVGGAVVRAPIAAQTMYDPALQETSPLNGVEAALSAFDAQFVTNLFLAKTERRFNNALIGGGSNSTATNAAEFSAEIAKRAATGTRFAVRNQTIYDRNNVPPGTPFRNLGSYYETLFQIEARHPLLQGSGVMFNRIAGPNAIPGVYNGVLLARINTDISLADFEIAVRDMLRDVERAYWELHYAYRNLDARLDARQYTLELWRNRLARLNQGLGTPVDETLARQQFYANQARVENALSGGAVVSKGLYTAERDLRRLMGLPPVDGRLIRPVTQPALARVEFGWGESLQECLTRREELRKQKWNVKRRELELVAARNMRLPRLDLVAQYGWRGWGDDLLGPGDVLVDLVDFEGNAGQASFPRSAFSDLVSGDLQDWRFGFECIAPIGNRLGHTAQRNAELQLGREAALLREMERQISHQLAEAFAEIDRAHALARSTYNAFDAAREETSQRSDRKDIDVNGVFLELDARQREADAEIAFYRSVIDYNVALLDLQYTRGTLLPHMQVCLAEGPWTAEAHGSAADQSRRFREGAVGHVRSDLPPVSAGAFEQQVDTGAAP